MTPRKLQKLNILTFCFDRHATKVVVSLHSQGLIFAKSKLRQKPTMFLSINIEIILHSLTEMMLSFDLNRLLILSHVIFVLEKICEFVDLAGKRSSEPKLDIMKIFGLSIYTLDARPSERVSGL